MNMEKMLATGAVLGLLSGLWGGPGGVVEPAQAHEAGATAHPSGDEPQLPKGVIGVSLHVGAERIGDPAVLYVAMVHPQGPAQQAGLQHGDEVTAVDGTPVAGKTYEQVILMVRGEPGKPVTLSVKGEKGARTLAINRVAGETLTKGSMDSHGGPAR